MLALVIKLLLVVAIVISLVSIPLCLRLARGQGRPVKVFDDIIGNLGIPLVFLPLVVTLPSPLGWLLVAAGVTITGLNLWFILRRRSPR